MSSFIEVYSKNARKKCTKYTIWVRKGIKCDNGVSLTPWHGAFPHEVWRIALFTSLCGMDLSSMAAATLIEMGVCESLQQFFFCSDVGVRDVHKGARSSSLLG